MKELLFYLGCLSVYSNFRWHPKRIEKMKSKKCEVNARFFWNATSFLSSLSKGILFFSLFSISSLVLNHYLGINDLPSILWSHLFEKQKPTWRTHLKNGKILQESYTENATNTECRVALNFYLLPEIDVHDYCPAACFVLFFDSVPNAAARNPIISRMFFFFTRIFYLSLSPPRTTSHPGRIGCILAICIFENHINKL